MKCSWVRKHLSAFLDGELDEKEQLEIKAHLKSCSSCTRERELLQSSWEMLSDWKDIEPSPHFKTNFWRNVREQESSKRKPIFYPQLFPRWAAALATAAILLVFVSLYLSPRLGRGPGLPTLAREEFEMVDLRDREIDLKETMDELSDEELGQLIQAIATAQMRDEAEVLGLALAEMGEIYLEEVMEELSGLEFGEEIILEAMVSEEMLNEVQDMDFEEGGVFL